MSFNLRTFRKLWLHMICQHIKMCILIKYTISESLVEIQKLRHEWSRIMYENTKKRNKIKWRSITCSHIWHINISKYVY